MATAGDYEKYGIRYNYNHGYLNGDEFNWRKKLLSQTYCFCKLGSMKSMGLPIFQASAYYSVGRGGGTGDIGRLGGNYASSSRFRNDVTGGS